MSSPRKGSFLCPYRIPIQAAIGGKIIASESISAYRKDVLAKCYGGESFS